MLSKVVRADRGTGRDDCQIDRFNAVLVSAAQVAAEMETLCADNDAPADILASPDVAAAIHARALALVNWRAAHDPHGESNDEALLEAAARFPLTEQAGEPGFEAAGFQELALFIEELPW
jgi:hypothetical protein